MRNSGNSARFAELSETVLRTIWQFNPPGATILGIHDYDHTMGDMSASAYKSHANTFKRCMTALQSEVNPLELDVEAQLDYHVALSLASNHWLILEHQRAWENNPSVFPSVCVWGVFSLLVRDFAPFEERMRCVLSRLREIPDGLAVSKENMAYPAAVFAETAVGVTAGALEFFRGPFIDCARSVPSLTSELLAANERVVAAFEDYGRWLSEDVLPRAEGSFAVGREVYQQMLFESHYLTYTPDELLKLAQSELDYSRARIAHIAAEIDPSVSWEELTARLKAEHPPKDGLLEVYRDSFLSARDFVIEHDLMTLAVGEELVTGETPPFERCVLPYAAYMPPAPFGESKRGCLWITPVDETAPPDVQNAQLMEHCKYSIPVLAVHEGYPGHHAQLTRAMESKHRVRKQAMNELFCEGWALYCESLMREEGFYTDPRIRLFQHKDMIWRACRVQIDIGLHTGQLSIDEAVQMLVHTARMEETSATAEVKRYASTPTQPMSYVVGRLSFLDLRQRMQRRLRSAFDLKSFHDELLSYGSIPPALIAARMLAQPLPQTHGRLADSAEGQVITRRAS